MLYSCAWFTFMNTIMTHALHYFEVAFIQEDKFFWLRDNISKMLVFFCKKNKANRGQITAIRTEKLYVHYIVPTRSRTLNSELKAETTKCARREGKFEIHR